jgi:hypothetical protein
MWDLAKQSMVLFLEGKLFASARQAYGLMATGAIGTAVVFLLAVKALHAPLVVAAPLVAFAGGLVQPRLFKNLKYR